MQNPQPNRRHTPNRRQRNRTAGQTTGISAHKSYASENDVADIPKDAALQLLPGPKTPHKPDSPAAASASAALNPNSQPKSRSAKQGRPKNVSTSPGPAKPGRRTPPQTAVPRAASAYAGATFHASPAASALPIPSFLAQSSTDSPAARDSPRPAVTQEPSPPATDSEMPTPLYKSPCAGPQSHREESPLDIFFRADRAEKERARRASSANALGPFFGPFSPPSKPASPLREPSAVARSPEPESPVHVARRPQSLRKPMLSFPSAELDGNYGPLGPAFSTPYHERIKAARSADKPATGDTATGGAPLSSPKQQQGPFKDRSEALRKYLFNGSRSTLDAGPVVAGPSGAFSPGPALAAPSSNDSSAHHSGPGRSDQPSPDVDVLALEQTLRRVLNMESTPASFAPAHTT